ncbi:Uncharacterised protein [Serratia fonticola]|uniref:Uncharacterized protein n=1 Tax=Serratia fonticola TaxID=47917 RepID=A0A4U9THP3_SERFO|nr:Uncharacterised protein [Serratia fonticola]
MTITSRSGLQLMEAWAEFSFRHCDQIKLQVGIAGGINVRIGALNALAAYF